MHRELDSNASRICATILKNTGIFITIPRGIAWIYSAADALHRTAPSVACAIAGLYCPSSGETAPCCERQHQPLPKRAGFQEELERRIIENEGRTARHRLDGLGPLGWRKDAGFQGGHDAVRRTIKRFKQRQLPTGGRPCAAHLRARRGVPVRLGRSESSWMR